MKPPINPTKGKLIPSDPANIPPLIRSRFPVGFPSVYGAINPPERVVLFEFCACSKTANIDIKKLEFRAIDIIPGTGLAQKQARQALSAGVYKSIMEADQCWLCEYPTEEGPVPLSRVDNNSLTNYFNGLIGSATGISALIRTPPNPSDVIFVYPAHFDLTFTGSTVVIVRSCIDHLNFRTDAINFQNKNDKRYYRDVRLTDDHKTLSFINSYWDGKSESPPEKNTPYNQEHKIDFEMVWSNWAYSDVTGQMERLMTPITIDPPMNNTGGGGPGGDP